MLHAVKRRVGLASAPLRYSPNAEFADLRQRLSSIKVSLKYTSQMLDAANRQWIIQMQEQRRFSERFAEAYPTTNDDTYIVATQFANGSQSLYDKFTRETNPDITGYQKISQQVMLFIKEIELVEASYSRLAMARSEAERYQSKLDAMERSRRPIDSAKKSRNLQKMDTERELYKKLLTETIEAQKKTYAKYPIVFKAALTAYWLSHEKHVNLLVQSLENTQEFAQRCEKDMMELDITTWVPPEPAGSPRYLEDKQSELSEEPNEEEQFHSASTIPLDSRDKGVEVTVESPRDSPKHTKGPKEMGTQVNQDSTAELLESPTSVANTMNSGPRSGSNQKSNTSKERVFVMAKEEIERGRMSVSST